MNTFWQDNNGWTHIDWQIAGITANMIDWHWSNLEKTYNLWHPSQHKQFIWVIPPTPERFIGAIHSAPQTRADGSYKIPKLRYDDIADLKENCRHLIQHDHCVLVSCITLGDAEVPNDCPAESYRIHQWRSTDDGVTGMSSAISFRGESKEEELQKGLLWEKHAAEEIETWGDFLHDLYRLWQPVKDPQFNRYHSLKIEKNGEGFRYAALQNK